MEQYIQEECQAVFVSDIHLSADHPSIARAFLRFLASHVASRAARLYVLGDLFEYWAGDDDLGSPFNSGIAEALHDLSSRGTEIFFISGNRDLLIGDAFAQAAGLKLLPDPSRIQSNGRSMLISHGDALCTDDVEYQAFRTMVRNPEWQRFFLAKPLEERRRIIESMRVQSENVKSEKAAEIMDVNETAVARLFEESGETLLIHGHTHRPARHVLTVEGNRCERWVLPDWNLDAVPARGGGLILDGAGLQIIGLD